MFAKLKQFRRVATRYDKLLCNYRGFVLIAAIILWLRRKLKCHHNLEQIAPQLNRLTMKLRSVNPL